MSELQGIYRCSYLDHNRERRQFAGAFVCIYKFLFFSFHVFILGLWWAKAVESFETRMAIHSIWIAVEELGTKV